MKRRDKALDRDAARWVVQLSSDQVTRSQEEQFKDWIGASDERASRYACHAALFEGVGALSTDGEARRILLSPPSTEASGSRWRRRYVLSGLGLAAAVAAAIVLLGV